MTNFSVNKKSSKFVKNADDQESLQTAQEGSSSSSKWDFNMLRKAFKKQGIDFDVAHAKCKDLIIKTLISVEPHISANVLKSGPTARVTCFEIYGFDIMIDSN